MAKQWGYNELYLEVAQSNDAALGFYRRTTNPEATNLGGRVIPAQPIVPHNPNPNLNPNLNPNPNPNPNPNQAHGLSQGEGLEGWYRGRRRPGCHQRWILLGGEPSGQVRDAEAAALPAIRPERARVKGRAALRSKDLTLYG